MNEPNIPVKVHILGKEYPIACSRDEEHELLMAASYLDEKMRTIRDSGRVIGTERIAVMAALNIAHEYIQTRQQNKLLSNGLGGRISALHEKIESAFGSE